MTLTSPDLPQPYTITGGPGTNDPSRFRAPRINLFGLLARAFGASTDQIVGPSWLRDVASANNFTVTATMPPESTKEEFQEMLRNLLVERFHLVFHHEMRILPGYALVVDKGGPKLQEVAPTTSANQQSNSGTTLAILSDGRGADGFPNLPAGPRTFSILGRGGVERTKYQERTMADFVSNLGFKIGSSQGKGVLEGYAQPRVVDKTGLTGRYTFILEYYNANTAALMASYRAQTGGGAPAAATDPPAAGDPEDTGPDIFAAIRKLGLRLDKTAGAPVDVIVVESIEKLPTPN